jgi:hypothetical protein
MAVHHPLYREARGCEQRGNEANDPGRMIPLRTGAVAGVEHKPK